MGPIRAARDGAIAFLAGLTMLVVAADVSAWSLPFREPAPPRTSAVYGSGIGADSLANTQVGGTSCGCPNLRSAYRFRAGRSEALRAIRVYLITDKEGYASGTGGTLGITLHEDDGSARHVPSDRVLASAVAPLETFPHVVFDAPASLDAGKLYHLVFENLDPEPTRNFVSIDGLYVDPATTPRQPQFSDTDWAQLMDYGEGWQLRPEYTPILQLEYGDGFVEGMGYMESWIGASRVISGATRVRQTIEVRGGDVPVSSISVRLGRVKGSGPLEVRLESSLGELIVDGSIEATAIPLITSDPDVDPSWVTLDLPTTSVLKDFHAYSLVLSTGPATSYMVHGIRKGVDYGFAPPTYFSDGHAQSDDGTGWKAFDPGWRGPLDQADLQFFVK